MGKIEDWRGIVFIAFCAAAMFFAKISYDYLSPSEPPPSIITNEEFVRALSKAEPQGFSKPQRNIAKEKIMPLLKTGVKPTALWSTCKGKNCVPDLSGVISLSSRAENIETFINQVCMIPVIKPNKKHWMVMPLYSYNEQLNQCELVNVKEVGLVTNRQTLVAAILASAIILGVALMGWGLFMLTKEGAEAE